MMTFKEFMAFVIGVLVPVSLILLIATKSWLVLASIAITVLIFCFGMIGLSFYREYFGK